MRPRPYGPFPYAPIGRRPPLAWPNGARVALWVIPNVEFFSLQDKVPAGSGGSGNAPPDVSQWAVRDYGNRIGIFRIMEVLDRYGIRGTVALNSDLCAQHPEILEEGLARRWEFMGHNKTNTKRLNEVSADEERAIVRDALATIEAATGRRPTGWLSSGLQETWQTLDVLVENGVRYVCDWTNDDQPYPMTLDDGRTITSIPYTLELNDKPVYEKRYHTPEEFEAMIRRQFDVLYREGAVSGRVMAIALHPYLTGMPHRIDALDRALEHVCSHAGVWLTTGDEIARHAETVAARPVSTG